MPNEEARLAALLDRLDELLREPCEANDRMNARGALSALHALLARGVTLAEAPQGSVMHPLGLYGGSGQAVTNTAEEPLAAALTERLRLRAALEQIRDIDDDVVFACARAIAAAALGNSDYECPEEAP